VVAELGRALKDPDPGVRAAAAHGLAELANPISPWAGKTSDARNPDDRLQRVPLKGVMATVLRLLKDPDPKVRDGAAELLGYAGDRSAVPALIAADPKTPLDSCAVCTALHRLGISVGLRHHYEVYPY
jgi:HEAT repeat protein